MAKAIWKFRLEITHHQDIAMPVGAAPLHVEDQGGSGQLWAVVDTDQPTEKRSFSIYGTGQPIDGDTGAYVGTFSQRGGALAWRVFEDRDSAGAGVAGKV